MKKQIKRFVLSVLVLTMVFSCVPATTYAKEQFKWSKSLVLSEKQYRDDLWNSEYSFAIFSDNGSEVTVKNFNGTVGAYSRPTPNKLYSGEELTDKSFWCGTVDVGTDLVDWKKNNTCTIELRRGWNWVTLIPCSDTKFKAGSTIKCKITAKDANLILMTSGKRPHTVYHTKFSKKKYNAFVKWWMPQYYSLQYADGSLNTDCKYAAEKIKSVGLSDLSKKELTSEIKKNVEKIYRQSNKNSKKFVSCQEAFVKYLDSINLKESLIEKYGKKTATEYWNILCEQLSWYEEDIQEYK